jgi:hypothetical protein
MESVPRVNIDGIEGSSIPGGLHLARYGGGDDYRQVKCAGMCAVSSFC